MEWKGRRVGKHAIEQNAKGVEHENTARAPLKATTSVVRRQRLAEKPGNSAASLQRESDILAGAPRRCDSAACPDTRLGTIKAFIGPTNTNICSAVSAILSTVVQ
ncbi:MAG: hypothetical protein ACI9G1_000969 [Pirellulaceae bacterium]|jgi:hypothetical protein